MGSVVIEYYEIGDRDTAGSKRQDWLISVGPVSEGNHQAVSIQREKTVVIFSVHTTNIYTWVERLYHFPMDRRPGSLTW